jgi:hypothetical protein
MGIGCTDIREGEREREGGRGREREMGIGCTDIRAGRLI